GEAVDAHARLVLDLRLLGVARELVALVAVVLLEVEHAERDLHLPRDGGGGAAGPVALQQRGVVHVRERVAVHHEEVVVEALDQAQRANRAERLVLAVVVDRDAVVVAVAEEGLDQLGQVAGRDRDVLEAVALELPDDDVEHGTVAHRHERLGQYRGVGPQSRSLAAGQYDCALHNDPPAGVRQALSNRCMWTTRLEGYGALLRSAYNP